MKIKRVILIITMAFIALTLRAQESETKSGWSWALMPLSGFDTDVGLGGGGMFELFDYGDGSYYPTYRHKLHIKYYTTTKGATKKVFYYDSDYLIPKARVSFEISNYREQALEFFGFNGYEAEYNPAYEDDQSEDYISRMYYRYRNNMTRIKADLQGDIIGRKLRWIGGINYYAVKTSTVDIDHLNKGKKEENMLPHVDLLFDEYVKKGIIPEDQKDGGNHTFIKAGISWDTRDFEAHPMSGIWTEFMVMSAPSFLSNTDYSFTTLAFIHRQYIPIIEKKLTVAYRLDYQPTLGDIPFYAMPIVHGSRITNYGYGGGESIRGIFRNRLLGKDVFYANMELRWLFAKSKIGKANMEWGVTTFFDTGRVTKRFDIPDNAPYVAYGKETFHNAYGVGFKFTVNKNMVVTMDYGMPANKQDGKGGFYIKTTGMF